MTDYCFDLAAGRRAGHRRRQPHRQPRLLCARCDPAPRRGRAWSPATPPARSAARCCWRARAFPTSRKLVEPLDLPMDDYRMAWRGGAARMTNLLEVSGVSKSFGPVQGAEGDQLRRSARRGPCAAGRERRRQIDPDQDHRRRDPCRRGRGAAGRQGRALLFARARRRPTASPRSIRSCCCSPTSPSPRTSISVMRRRPSGARSTGTRMRAGARALLDSLDSPDLDVDTTVGKLSVANRQRVEIAKALSQDAQARHHGRADRRPRRRRRASPAWTW